jgi:hypothetical protein
MTNEIENWRSDYSWKEAFVYGSSVRSSPGTEGVGQSAIGIDDVTEVIAMQEGENDGPAWIMAGRVKDGRYFFLSAGCDYTGWDCQASGDVIFAASREDLIRFCLTNDDRERLSLSL